MWGRINLAFLTFQIITQPKIKLPRNLLVNPFRCRGCFLKNLPFDQFNHFVHLPSQVAGLKL